MLKSRPIMLSWCHRRTKYTMSKFFQPFDVIPHNQGRDNSLQETDSVSARLMTNYGVVRQAGPGTFHLLPLGFRAQSKLETIIDTELQKVGCLKISMPHVTQARDYTLGFQCFNHHDFRVTCGGQVGG